MQKYLIIINIFLFFLYGNIAFSQDAEGNEMRGAWIATAKNIDYPTSKYLSTKKQKQEFIQILDLYQKIGINAVFFQVRPAADAFYKSEYEPWSEWLTGRQGKAPNPYYDPLKFMITECHKRGIEFHAWFNPFRAVANIETANISRNHITRKKPKWFFTYGINKYFNPGIPEARAWVINVITDVVRRYDIDGVHFDDYFYPYPEKNDANKIIAIPDYQTYKKYNKGKFKTMSAWRRNNLDIFIKTVRDSIKNINPRIKYGVAPSGIWRNRSHDKDGSNTRGFEHYDGLYADVVKWLREGWIDYVAPQLYWNIGHPVADYKTLVIWWSKHTYGKHLYIGQAPYRAINPTTKAWQNPHELPNQMRLNRKTPEVLGSIFYKTSALKKNPLGFNDSLRVNFYAQTVSTPKMDWLPELVAVVDTISGDTVLIVDIDKTAPLPVKISATKLGKKYMISWETPKYGKTIHDDVPEKYFVYKYKGFDAEFVSKEDEISQTTKTYIFIKRKRFRLFKKKYNFVVKSIDKAGNISKVSNEIILKL